MFKVLRKFLYGRESAGNCPPKADQPQADNRSCITGQAMLLTTVMIGGLFMLATSIAGLLVFYQLQQATDAGNSTVAIYAADAALEQAVYEYFNNEYFIYDPAVSPDKCPSVVNYLCSYKSEITLDNGARGEAVFIVPPPDTSGSEAKTIITATGRDAGGRTVRLLQTTFLVTPERR